MRFVFGEIAIACQGATVYSGGSEEPQNLLVDILQEEENCILLSCIADRYYVFLQQTQIHGWIYYYDLERLNG